MSSLPLWGRVRVGAADNGSAGLEFCRVAVQVMVWKEVYCCTHLYYFRNSDYIHFVWLGRILLQNRKYIHCINFFHTYRIYYITHHITGQI